MEYSAWVTSMYCTAGLNSQLLGGATIMRKTGAESVLLVRPPGGGGGGVLQWCGAAGVTSLPAGTLISQKPHSLLSLPQQSVNSRTPPRSGVRGQAGSLNNAVQWPLRWPAGGAGPLYSTVWSGDSSLFTPTLYTCALQSELLEPPGIPTGSRGRQAMSRHSGIA